MYPPADRRSPILCLLSSLLPVEVGGGAHDHERREASRCERADRTSGLSQPAAAPAALRASQDDRGTGARADQELADFKDSGVRGKTPSASGVHPGLRGAQPQENHFFGSAGRGVSGVREASGLGGKGRIRADEVKNRPLSLFSRRLEQSIGSLGFGGQDSRVFGALGQPLSMVMGEGRSMPNSRIGS